MPPKTSHGFVMVHENHNEKQEYKKQAIPKPRRKEVWTMYCGNNFQSLCFCCHHATITAFEFECGHVLAEKLGGTIDVSNLRPICSTCNKSMRTECMTDFMRRLNYKQSIHWNGYRPSASWFSCLNM